MTPRKPITDKMKIASLRFYGLHMCPECLEVIRSYQVVEWDHRQALIHDGTHDHENIRMVHVACHAKKTARDVKANAKVKRIAKGGRTRKGPKIAARGFAKKPEGYKTRWSRT